MKNSVDPIHGFTGEKVVLRPIRRDDLPLMLRWQNDPEVMYYANDDPRPHISREEVETQFQRETEAWAGWMRRFIVETVAGDAIGTIMYRNYCEDTRSAAMGLYLGEKAYWGQGCGSEAIRLLLDYLFREMKLHKVHITVSDFNTRAIRVYAKCGFRRDGVLRHNAIIDGRLVDHLVMSILEEEWGGRTIDIEPFTEQYQAWACEEMTEQWSSPLIVSRGRLHQADTLPGFVALIDGAPQGLLTYRIEEEEECEVVTLHAVIEGIGIGTALLDAARRLAKARGCRRLWLVTANENTPALRFYQKRGFTLVAVYPDAFTEYRKLKPSIPLTGIDGIPIRDEIELEIRFGEKR